jgi:molybdate transport system substrate-binding protein
LLVAALYWPRATATGAYNERVRLVLLFLVFLASAVVAAPPPPLTVSAAISLTNVLDALGPMYAQGGGGPVRFNYGASNVLARQIVNGAPVDVFISADEAQMDVVAAAGRLSRDTRVNLLGNRLAVITTRVQPVSLKDVSGLTAAAIRRIAIGDPAGVPAGIYARQYLEKRGLWQTLQPKLVPVPNVRAAVAAVEYGSVDAAVVYESDVATAKADVAFVVSGAEAPRIVYSAAVVNRPRLRDDAVRFVKFLCGDEAAAVFTRHKFVPLRCR